MHSQYSGDRGGRNVIICYSRFSLCCFSSCCLIIFMKPFLPCKQFQASSGSCSDSSDDFSSNRAAFFGCSSDSSAYNHLPGEFKIGILPSFPLDLNPIKSHGFTAAASSFHRTVLVSLRRFVWFHRIHISCTWLSDIFRMVVLALGL